MRAHEKRLTAVDHDVGLFELRPTGAQAFNFPALQRQPGLVLLLDEVIMPSLAVLRDGGVVVFFVFGVAHATSCVFRRVSPLPLPSPARGEGELVAAR